MDCDIGQVMARLYLQKLQVWPIFERGAARLKEATALGQHVDVLPEVQFTMAEATLSIFFGDVRRY